MLCIAIMTLPGSVENISANGQAVVMETLAGEEGLL